MRDADLNSFGQMLDAVCSLLSRGQYQPNPMNTALWFRALAGYDLDSIRRGFDAHVKDPQRGRFVPTPADVVAQLSGAAQADGRPGPEEAWAIALQASDEARTVVWTEDMAQAWGVAFEVLKRGDDVGARMTFREVYNRAVTDARADGRKVHWFASIGHDPEQRDEALQRAHVAGLLAKPEKVHEPLALEHAMSPANKAMPQTAREKLLALRERLAGPKTEEAHEEAFPLGSGMFNPIPRDLCPWNRKESTE